MAIPEDQVRELASAFAGVEQHDEGGLMYFLIPALLLPENCSPAIVDALLCPMHRDNYASRMFFAQKIEAKGVTPNWNFDGLILGRKWWAFSWRSDEGQRLCQMIAMYLRALRCN